MAEEGAVEVMRQRPVHQRPAIAVLFCALATMAFAVPARAACPNEALREEQGVLTLPDCMALEMVSPPKKFVQAAFEPSFSLNGERVLFRSMAGLANTPGLHHPFGDRYVASRAVGGWSTMATSAPTSAAIANGPGSWKGGPNSFSPDLSRWILLGATTPQERLGIGQAFQGGLDGSFSPLSPPLVPIEEIPTGIGQGFTPGVTVGGASVDSSSIIFQHPGASTSYFPEDPRAATTVPEPGAATNTYLASLRPAGPSLALLARDQSGKAYGGRCGAVLGGAGANLEGNINQGAVSADGLRIYFTTRPAQPDSVGSSGPPCDASNPLRVMRRVETSPGVPEITELPHGDPSEPGDDLYQGASLDGTKVYLTTPRDLAASDTDTSAEPCDSSIGASKGCDLYLYDSALPEGERVIQVSAGGTGDPSPGQGANVLSSITAISGDGSHAYFVAQGVLTTDANPEGEVAEEGAPNLYAFRWDSDSASEHTAFVGTLAESDKSFHVWGSDRSFFGDAYAVPLLGEIESGPEDGGDGHVLVFSSGAPLTSSDEDAGHQDVFRYNSTADTLQRLSEAAAGGLDNGPFDVSVNPNDGSPAANFAGEGRWVSEDGETVAFSTPEALVPGDEDGVANPYFWRAGELGLIAGAIPPSGFPSRPPTVSLDGNQVAFAVTSTLLPQDSDTASDVYVARVNGGFLPPPPSPICIVSVNCQVREPQPSPTPPPASGTPTAGNVNGKRCKKGFVAKRGKCIKKPKQRHPKSGGRSKRGGG